MRRLIIFEGPNGAGKTTLAEAVADKLNVTAIHHGPYFDIPLVRGDALLRKYTESLLPALEGEHDIVLDRCWISERVYGAAYRCGENRVRGRETYLERLARCCKVLVVFCLPPWAGVKARFEARTAGEYQSGVGPLHVVYEQYQHEVLTTLPSLRFDPFTMAERVAATPSCREDYAVDFVLSYLGTQYDA